MYIYVLNANNSVSWIIPNKLPWCSVPNWLRVMMGSKISSLHIKDLRNQAMCELGITIKEQVSEVGNDGKRWLQLSFETMNDYHINMPNLHITHVSYVSYYILWHITNVPTIIITSSCNGAKINSKMCKLYDTWGLFTDTREVERQRIVYKSAYK